MDEIQRKFDELNAPSASKLLAALRAEGHAVTKKTVSAFVRDARHRDRELQEGPGEGLQERGDQRLGCPGWRR